MPSPCRILVIHPEPALAAELRRALSGDAFDVMCAASADEASEARRRFAPDLVIVDAKRPAPGDAAGELGDSVLRVGDLVLDAAAHHVSRGGTTIDLTPTEFRLLNCLMAHPEHVLARHLLLETVWQYDFGGDARVLETYISYLRRKLEWHGERLIHTVRGVGYVLRPAPVHNAPDVPFAKI